MEVYLNTYLMQLFEKNVNSAENTNVPWQCKIFKFFGTIDEYFVFNVENCTAKHIKANFCLLNFETLEVEA